MVKVSVLIPCNNTFYLGQTLKSVDSQGFNDIEIVVVADGIETGEVTKIYSGPNLLRVLASPGTGIVDALNYGIEESTGELIARIDADDIMLPMRLIEQVKFLDENRSYVAIGGQMIAIDAEGIYRKKISYPTNSEAVHSELLHHSALPHPGTTYRRSSALDSGLYRRQFQYVEDWDLWLRMMELGRLNNLGIPVTAYRIHEKQTSVINTEIQTKRMQSVLISKMLRARGLSDVPSLHTDPDEWVRNSKRVIGTSSDFESFEFSLSSIKIELAILRTAKIPIYRLYFLKNISRLGLHLLILFMHKPLRFTSFLFKWLFMRLWRDLQ